jgi:hypothetical protein
VGGFSGSFNVSAVDTFIEKPFSVLALWTLSNCGNVLATAGNRKVWQVGCLVGQCSHHARGRFGDKPRLGLLFSFSVWGLA